MTTQEILAEFITSTKYSDIDEEVVTKARATIIDCLGVALAGSLTELGESLRRYFRVSGVIRAEASSMMIGTSDRTDPPHAALYNGAIAHALDYDDDCHPGNFHLTANLLPAVMSALPDEEFLSERFLCAYIVGYEVSGKLGRILPRSKRGLIWHGTGILAPVGCAAAVAKALELDRSETAHALGIAASCGAGLVVNFGSMTKPLHSGRSAQAGAQAGLLAQQGFESSADAFDGPTGFFAAYGTSDRTTIARDTSEALSMLAEPWVIATDLGLRMKSWPSCGGTHPAIEAALLLREKIGSKPIASIRLGGSIATWESLTYHLPRDPLQGKFSMEYCVAAVFLWGGVGIDSFEEVKMHSAEMREMIGKMTYEVDDRVRDSICHSTIIDVTTEDGAVYTEAIPLGKGSGERWMTRDDQRIKFDDTAGRALGIDQSQALFHALWDVDHRRPDEITRQLRTSS